MVAKIWRPISITCCMVSFRKTDLLVQNHVVLSKRNFTTHLPLYALYALLEMYSYMDIRMGQLLKEKYIFV
jgi:hypothetical protein